MERKKVIVNDYQNLQVLVLGVGSIGERHIRNLWALGVTKITAYRTRNLPFRDIGPAKVTVITDLNQLQPSEIDCAIICSPTNLHLSQSIWCAENGIHTLVEKPISNTDRSISDLLKIVVDKQLVFSVAYMMRFHPLLIELKKIIASKIFGKVVHIESEWREYLPDWHPWEDYRKSYAALAEMGGGAALTLSHDLDLVTWLLDANPIEWQTNRIISSSLETTSDTVADFSLIFPNKVPGRVHLNMAAPISQRKTQVIFEQALVTFYYYDNKLVVAEKNKPKQDIHLAEFERNQMYVSELDCFLGKVLSRDYSQSAAQIEQAAFIVKLAIS